MAAAAAAEKTAATSLFERAAPEAPAEVGGSFAPGAAVGRRFSSARWRDTAVAWNRRLETPEATGGADSMEGRDGVRRTVAALR